MIKGQCNCGAIAFEVSEDVSDIYVCHCSICRRSTGTSGIPVVIVNKAAFSWVEGEEHIQTWRKPDADWQTWFCKICGSPLPGENDETRLFIPAGILTEGIDNLEIKHHIWVGSKAPWDEISDCGKRHQNAFNAE